MGPGWQTIETTTETVQRFSCQLRLLNLSFSVFRHPGRLSSRLHSDVDRMGRTVALNANALVRSTVKTCLMLTVMLRLSWELTVLTCIEMPLLAILQNKYITWYRVSVMTWSIWTPQNSGLLMCVCCLFGCHLLYESLCWFESFTSIQFKYFKCVDMNIMK